MRSHPFVNPVIAALVVKIEILVSQQLWAGERDGGVRGHERFEVISLPEDRPWCRVAPNPHARLTFYACPLSASFSSGINTSRFTRIWVPANTVCLGCACTG